MSFDNGRWTGMEALARRQQPPLRQHPFHSAGGTGGLIDPPTEVIIGKALRDGHLWGAGTGLSLNLSMNLSPPR